jgi:N-acetylglucosamine kinase-like BadF-type ATPase
MGRKVMELFSKQSDGRMPEDELLSVVRRELCLNNDFSFIDLMYDEYITNRDKVASLQLLAEKAAIAGSKSAKELYRVAAYELCLMITAIKDRLNFTNLPFLVSYTGGLFRAGDLIMPYFSQLVEEVGGVLVSPKFTPAQGALLMAFQQFYPAGLADIHSCLVSAAN